MRWGKTSGTARPRDPDQHRTARLRGRRSAAQPLQARPRFARSGPATRPSGQDRSPRRHRQHLSRSAGRTPHGTPTNAPARRRSPTATGHRLSRKTSSVKSRDERGLYGILRDVPGLNIGYARVSTDQQGPHRPTRRPASARRPRRAHLRRPRPGWHQPRASRAAPGARGVPRRRHARRHQARPARALAARRARDRRPSARSSSTSAARYTTRPTPSAGCCSTSSRWSPNSSPTSSACAPARA
jgi:hypothetical protein